MAKTKFVETEPAKLKAYYTLIDDGAFYRCTDCGRELPPSMVLLPAPFTPVCKKCLGEWAETATCLGEK